MLLSFRRPRIWAALLGVAAIIVIVVIVAIVAISGDGDDKDGGGEDIQRSPDTPIVIPAGQPIVVGVSSALTGPTESLGAESVDATVVGGGDVEAGQQRSDQGP